MRPSILFFFIISGLVGSQAYAQTVTINDSPRPFSVKAPKSWVQQPTSTGNSRVRFVSPNVTPPAECAVIAKELSLLRGLTQQTLDLMSLELVSQEEIRQHLSSNYNNVQVISTGVTIISGYPAQTLHVQYSTGTPDGELWARGFTSTTKTTPWIGMDYNLWCSWVYSGGGFKRLLLLAV